MEGSTTKQEENPGQNQEGEEPKELTAEQLQKIEDDKKYLEANWEESVDRFDDMGLKEEVLRGIYGYGFNKPSPI